MHPKEKREYSRAFSDINPTSASSKEKCPLMKGSLLRK
jgi:hypothetical protein